MSERKQTVTGASPGARAGEAWEARLRALYTAAYPATYASVEPSEALERRVAALAARHDPDAGRRPAWRLLLPMRFVAAAGAVAALCLLAWLSLTLHPRRDPVRPNRVVSLPGRDPIGPAAPSISMAPRKARGEPPIRGHALPPRAGLNGNTHSAPPVATPQSVALVNNRAPTPSTRYPMPAQDDLVFLNGGLADVTRDWVSVPADEWERIETRVRRNIHVRDDFVSIPFPRLAAATDAPVATAVASYQREAAIVDSRLSRELTLAFKATALSDLCDRLRADTGIHLEAGASIADEKVTVFCEKLPLREVMRQLSRPFGYTWLRSGKEGDYRYELVQDLRSQLLEEELRNRDRDAALIALDREMSRYRAYLSLSPDEARARAQTATPEEKKLLERLAGRAWGPIQMYFRLSRDDLVALRSGQTLTFSEEPKPGERLLPRELARGVIQDLGEVRLIKKEDGYDFARGRADPGAVPLTAVPEARAGVRLAPNTRELGQFTLEGSSRFRIASTHESAGGGFSDGPLALGISPAVRTPDNAQANARRAHDPSLRPRVTVRPQPSCLPPAHSPVAAPTPVSEADGELKVTSADVLEAIHQVTGLPIVADYYTRLYALREVSTQSQSVYDALNHVTDAMRLRWDKEGPWLRFRSTSFYDDRVKEVPNRLLSRWADERRRHGMLSLEELIEVAGLSDAQLDASDMAEGARRCWGLWEWDLARSRPARSDWRYLAQLTPSQRQEAQSATGLPFNRMSPVQQQRFLAAAAGEGDEGTPSLEELSGATFRVVYTQPGGFEWPGTGHPTVLQFRPSPVYARTREAALQEARRISTQVTEAQIVPTELAVTVLYSCGAQNGAYVRVCRTTPKGTTSYDGRPRPVADRN